MTPSQWIYYFSLELLAQVPQLPAKSARLMASLSFQIDSEQSPETAARASVEALRMRGDTSIECLEHEISWDIPEASTSAYVRREFRGKASNVV